MGYLKLSTGLINKDYIVRIITYPDMYEIHLHTSSEMENPISIYKTIHPNDYKIIERYIYQFYEF